MWFSLHHHFLQCLFCREQDINMHRIYGRWVSLRLKQVACFFPFASYSCIKETLGEKSSFSLPCTHLHFCRSRECLIAVSCLACLCAKSYKGVINLDLSAVVGVFVCAFTGVRWRTVGFFCFLGGCGGKLYMFVKMCVNAVISLDSHIF